MLNFYENFLFDFLFRYGCFKISSGYTLFQGSYSNIFEIKSWAKGGI